MPNSHNLKEKKAYFGLEFVEILVCSRMAPRHDDLAEEQSKGEMVHGKAGRKQ